MGSFAVSTLLLVLTAVTANSYASGYQPPDFMAEAKRQTDSTTILKQKFGLCGGIAMAIPFGDETYRSDLSKSRSFSIGIFERARLRKSHLVGYTVNLSFYYERFQSDHESIINRYRPWFNLPDTPFQSTGGDHTTTGLLIEASFYPPWVNRPVLPFARFAMGVGRYKVEDLKATWDDFTFTYLGYDDWILLFGGGLGIKHDFESGHFVALEVRFQSFGSLTAEGEAIDTPSGPVGPPSDDSTPASVGIHLTAGIAIF